MALIEEWGRWDGAEGEQQTQCTHPSASLLLLPSPSPNTSPPPAPSPRSLVTSISEEEVAAPKGDTDSVSVLAWKKPSPLKLPEVKPAQVVGGEVGGRGDGCEVGVCSC